MTLENLRENRSARAIVLNMLLAAVSLFINGFGVYLTIHCIIEYHEHEHDGCCHHEHYELSL